MGISFSNIGTVGKEQLIAEKWRTKLVLYSISGKKRKKLGCVRKKLAQKIGRKDRTRCYFNGY